MQRRGKTVEGKRHGSEGRDERVNLEGKSGMSETGEGEGKKTEG